MFQTISPDELAEATGGFWWLMRFRGAAAGALMRFNAVFNGGHTGMPLLQPYQIVAPIAPRMALPLR